MAPRRGTLLLVGVWVLGALLSTTVGVVAVRQVREEVGDPGTQPLSASDVRQAVASVTPTRPVATRPPASRPPATPPVATRVPTRQASPRPSTQASTRPTASHTATATKPPAAAPTQRRTFQSEGGSIAVECSGRRPRLVYVLPASGWSVDEQETRDDRVEVRFRSGEREADLKVGCNAAGTPVEVADD